MILIKTLFLNLIPEEVTVVEPAALVGVVVNLFYVFIFIYRTWIVAPTVLVVNKERLSPLATKLLPTHLIDRNRSRMQAPSFSDAFMSATSEELSSSVISSEGGSRDAFSVELSSSIASI